MSSNRNLCAGTTYAKTYGEITKQHPKFPNELTGLLPNLCGGYPIGTLATIGTQHRSGKSDIMGCMYFEHKNSVPLPENTVKTEKELDNIREAGL